jgi:hypothetical protein
LRFDEIFASAVSDRPSQQRFKKSNFSQLRSLFLSNLNFFGCYTTHNHSLPTHPAPISRPTAQFQSMPPRPPIEAFKLAAAMDCNQWHPVSPPSLPLPRFGLRPPLTPIDGAHSRLQTCRAAIYGCKLGCMSDPSIGSDDVPLL